MLAFMFIEQIFPAVVTEKSTLRDRLFAEATARRLSNEQLREIISSIPKALIDAGAFLDKMTNLWRYEFGIPYDIGKDFIWGTHIWVPVHCLFNALWCAHWRLPKVTCVDYLKRLADPSKHQATLVEMIPGYKVDSEVAVRFEVPGQGAGNHTIDWLIGPHGGRTVLLDVKLRTTDFIKLAERIGGDSVAPEPTHDPALLFRSVENKFESADPNLRLQGVWIVTDIKQNEKLLTNAFVALNPSKAHFVILGDWKSDAYVLVRQVEDEQYLRDLFHIERSERFTFTQDEG
jgi:hypothetical protein